MLKTDEITARAIKVGEVVKDREPQITVQEVADILEISKTSAHRMMWMWLDKGIVKYIAQDNERGNWYWLGVK